MSLLHINGFTIDASVASLETKYPNSTGSIGSPEFRVEGYNGGDALRVRSTSTALVYDGDAGPAPSGGRFVMGARLRVKRPKFQVPFLVLYSGVNRNKEQFRVIFSRPSIGSNNFYFIVADTHGRTLDRTQELVAEEWIRFEIKADITDPATSFLELRLDGVTLLRFENVEIKNPTAPAGWSRVHIGLQAQDLTGYIDIDDLYLCDGSTNASNEYTDFLGDVTVDGINPILDAALIPGLGFTPGGSAASVTDGVDDGVSGTFDKDTTYAQTGLTLAAHTLFFEKPSRSHQAILGLSFDFNAKLVSGAAAVLLRYLTDGARFFIENFDVVTSSTYKRYSQVLVRDPRTSLAWVPEQIPSMFFGLAKTDNTVAVVRVSQVSVEILVVADQEVVPADLPTHSSGASDAFPAPHFEPNWRDGVEMTTAYRTTVVAGRETRFEERRSLQTRPVRSQTVTLTALSEGLTQDLFTRLVKSTLRPVFPMPIWQDRMTVLSGTINANGTATFVVEDTRYRRLFYGQRITLVRSRPVRSRDPQALLFWRVDSWSKTTITCTGGPAFSVAVDTNDRLYPCMDTDRRLNAELSMHTLESSEAIGLETRETQASSSLPGVIQSFTGAPFLTKAGSSSADEDQALLFPFKPDWSSAQRMTIGRVASSVQLGKGVYEDVDGERPVFTMPVNLRFMGRVHFWRWLKFFDLVRGRALWFWMPLPVKLWDVDVSSSTGTRLRLEFPSWVPQPHTLFPEVFSELALILDLPSRPSTLNTYFPFKVNSATLGSGNQVNVFLAQSAAPYLPLLKHLRPAVKMRLRQDAFSERWETLEKCYVRVEVESVEDTEPVPITDVTTREETRATPDQISDLFMWFDANRNVYAYDELYEGYVESNAWPDRHWMGHAWFDARKDVPPKFKSGPSNQQNFPTPFLRQGTIDQESDRIRLLRFQTTNYLKNTRGLIDNTWLWGMGLDGFDSFPIESRLPWDNTKGMTLFAVFIDPRTYTQSSTNVDRPLLKFQATTGTLFEWYPFNAPNAGFNGLIRMYQSPGQLLGSKTLTLPNLGHSGLGFFSERLCIAVFRWKPGVAAQTQFFLNGIPTYTRTASSSPTSIATGTDLTYLPRFSTYLETTPVILGYPSGSEGFTGELDRALNREGKGILFGLLGYKRALSNPEINSVASHLAGVYDMEWTDI